MAYHKILIAIDRKLNSLKVAKSGLELAHQLKAETALLYVIHPADIEEAKKDKLPQEAKWLLNKEAEETLNMLATFYNISNITRLVQENAPKESILKTAQEWEANLIIMGTHCRTDLSHLLLGSVATNAVVIHHAKIPVMVIPSE